MKISGDFNEGKHFHCDRDDLEPNTEYLFRVCGRRGTDIYNGTALPFKTPIYCNTALNRNGGPEGLDTTYVMGPVAGRVNVEFDAMPIPDKLEIWQGSRLILSTYDFVSGVHTWENVQYNPDDGQEWRVHVSKNSNEGTWWTLSVSCPQ